MFFDKDEVFHRVHRRWNKGGQRQEGPLAIHHNTRCKLDGFIAVGPLFMGNRSHGMSWFDIRIKVGSPEYFELDKILKQVCNELRLYYEPVQEKPS